MTAQHLDDQCETFLLALKRGSGPTGLSAMAASSEFAGGKLLRPLLNESRESLHQWALTHQLRWIEDESNQDDAYDRNFLRLRVLPLLSERWPHLRMLSPAVPAYVANRNSCLMKCCRRSLPRWLMSVVRWR